MTNKAKRILSICLLAALVAIPVRMVYAYFTDYESARGGAVVHLAPETEIIEIVDDVHKELSIVNTGETSVIVRVAVFGSYIENFELPSDWTQDGEYFYYNQILEPGATTSTIIVNIDVEAAAAAQESFDVTVINEAEAVAWIFDGSVNTVRLPDGWTRPNITVGV